MPSAGKRGKYLGFVAHEIKNPLATALWSCDLLKRMEGADRTGERGEKMIDVSLRALRRMRRLVDDYFTLERLLEDGYELKRDRVQRSINGCGLRASAVERTTEADTQSGGKRDEKVEVHRICSSGMLLASDHPPPTR